MKSLRRPVSALVVAALALSFVLGCAGGASQRENALDLDKAKTARAAPAVSGSALASASGSAEPAAASCPEPANPAPKGSDRASFVLQDGHTSLITTVELSGDGRLLASTGMDGTVRLWDTKTGLQLRRIQTQGTSLSTSLSTNGATLAFLRSDSGSVPSVATVALGRGADSRAMNLFGSFRLSPDGKTLAAGWDGLDVVDPETGAKLQALQPFKPPAKAPAGAKLDPAYKYNVIGAVGFDETGSRLAVASGLEIAIIDTATWKVILRRPHGMGVPAGSPGGPPPARPKPAPQTQGPAADPKVIHPGWFPSSLIFKGDTLVLVSPLGVRMLRSSDGGNPRDPKVQAQSAAILGDALLTTDAFERVAAWSLATGAPKSIAGLDRLKGYKIAVSSDGSTLAVATKSASASLARSGLMELRIHDARSMRLLKTIEPHLTVVEGAAIKQDGTELAVASRDGGLARFSLVTGELKGITKGALGIPPWTLAYDDSGDLIAAVSHSRHMRLHDARTGRLVRQWEPTGQTLVTAWFNSGKKELVTLDSTGAMKTWDVAPSAPLQPPVDLGIATIAKPAAIASASIPGPVAGAAVSRDRKRVAAITADHILTTADPTGVHLFRNAYSESDVVLADAQTGKALWTTRLVSGYAATKWVGFAPDDATVLFSSMDDTRNLISQTGQIVRAAGDLLRLLDPKTGSVTRSEKVLTAGPIASSAKAFVVGGRAPLLFAWPALTSKSVKTPDYLVNTVAEDPRKGSFVFGGDSGGTTLAGPDGDVAAIFASAGGGEYVTATLDGVFRSSIDGARNIAWTFGLPLEGFSFEQFAARFARPDIVASRLAGAEAASPADVIRPPSVSLERAGADGAPILTRTARVRAAVESPGRVDRVRVFVNGRPASEELVCAARGAVDVEAPVVAGRNRITVVAYDADGFASNPETIDVTSAAASAASPDLWVVSVGVSKYKNLAREHQLEFADDDARSIADALAGEAGPGRPFGALHATTLLDDQVTVESVERALSSLSAMGADDLAVVFLAGHGVSLDEGKMVYLTSGASLSLEGARAHGIGWDRIRAALSRAKGRVIVLLDACHSGHVSTELIAPNESLAQELSTGGRSGVLVFAAARGSQLSYEVAPAGASGRAASGVGSRGLELAWEGKPAAPESPLAGGHGLFTSAVLEALSGQAPDADRSGAVEVGELIDYVTERVRQASNGQQTPWVVRREMFGDFVVAPASQR